MLLKKLTDANGLPGYEDDVRQLIRTELQGCVDLMRVDRMGNLIAVKNPDAAGAHIALAAHMDEAGLAVKSIDGGGYIRLVSLGADAASLGAKAVKIGKNGVPGVIGTKVLHLKGADERRAAPDADRFYVDIGARSREEAAELAAVGDYIAFDSEYREFGDGRIKAKALDSRIGCAAIIEILKGDLPYKITAAFCAQKLVGLRGSAVAANGIFADLVVNIDAARCADTGTIPAHRQAAALGAGPAISVRDRGISYPGEHIERALAAAKRDGIPCRLKGAGGDATDAVNFHSAHGGTPVLGLAAPCRYMHSPAQVADRRDCENLRRLLQSIIISYNGEA